MDRPPCAQLRRATRWTAGETKDAPSRPHTPRYASLSAAFVAVSQLALGEGQYYDLENASGVAAAGLFYWTFVLVITVVFLNMVLSILFFSYEQLQARIDEADEIPIGGALLRAALLGRAPSLFEEHLEVMRFALLEERTTVHIRSASL